MDRELVALAQGGDEAAFIDLIRTRSPRLLGIAVQILRDIPRAEDALQDALVLAWRDLRSLRDGDRFDAWLRRIVVNVCIRQAARERRRTEALQVIPDDGPAAPDDSLGVALRDQLERGFQRLSPNQRATLVLYHYGGFTAAEIGDALGVPMATARSRLRHAQHAMRAALEADARLTPASEVSR